MTTPSKAKGDAFERLVVNYLRSNLGAHIDRGRAGASDDRGDVHGIQRWTLELKSYSNVATGLRNGLADLAVEQTNTQTPYGAVVLKRHGTQDPAKQLFVMELGQAVNVIQITSGMDKVLKRVDL